MRCAHSALGVSPLGFGVIGKDVVYELVPYIPHTEHSVRL